MFEILKAWFWTRSRPLREQLAVEYDESSVCVRALGHTNPAWNQACHWADITRVCFRDGGLARSDIVYLDVRGRPQPVQAPLEAIGGDEFFVALRERGLFPQPYFGRAVRSTDGGLYCWPSSEVADG